FPELPKVITQAALVCPAIRTVHDADSACGERLTRIAGEPGGHDQCFGIQAGADVEELLRVSNGDFGGVVAALQPTPEGSNDVAESCGIHDPRRTIPTRSHRAQARSWWPPKPLSYQEGRPPGAPGTIPAPLCSRITLSV